MEEVDIRTARRLLEALEAAQVTHLQILTQMLVEEAVVGTKEVVLDGKVSEDVVTEDETTEDEKTTALGTSQIQPIRLTD